MISLHSSSSIVEDDRRNVTQLARMKRRPLQRLMTTSILAVLSIHPSISCVQLGTDEILLVFFFSRRLWLLECHRSSPRSSIKQPYPAFLDYRTAGLEDAVRRSKRECFKDQGYWVRSARREEDKGKKRRHNRRTAAIERKANIRTPVLNEKRKATDDMTETYGSKLRYQESHLEGSWKGLGREDGRMILDIWLKTNCRSSIHVGRS